MPDLNHITFDQNNAFDPNHHHWPSTARHEAGHAVAAIIMFRKFDRHWASFDRVLVRPGAIGPHIDDRGRAVDCVGMVEGPSQWNPGITPKECLRGMGKDEKTRIHFQISMEIEIVSMLGGPFAGVRAVGGRSKWYAQFDGNTDWERARSTLSDMRTMTRRGSLRAFESQTFQLVKRYWPAIDALGEELMQRHCLEYDEALAIVRPFLSARQ